ncbi:hypothetical protein SDC9_132721 [bioreactor metagenome]|uniref:Uncharacterized protein n=1 Tax=bioreactor metagenome TaxID=1076179 RepID=A0A645D7Z1_9ZZZZ
MLESLILGLDNEVSEQRIEIEKLIKKIDLILKFLSENLNVEETIIEKLKEDLNR